MGKEVLSELNDRLKERFIPARLIEDGNVLTVLLELKEADISVYGDIFFTSFEAEQEIMGLAVLEWEVMDLSPFADQVQGNICVNAAGINSQLPFGGYAVRTTEEGEMPKLIYRGVLPVGQIKDDKWLADELFEAIDISAKVLSATAPTFKGLTSDNG